MATVSPGGGYWKDQPRAQVRGLSDEHAALTSGSSVPCTKALVFIQCGLDMVGRDVRNARKMAVIALEVMKGGEEDHGTGNRRTG